MPPDAINNDSVIANELILAQKAEKTYMDRAASAEGGKKKYWESRAVAQSLKIAKLRSKVQHRADGDHKCDCGGCASR